MSSFVSCLICSPVTFALTLVFGFSIPKEGACGFKLVSTYLMCWTLMACCAALSSLIEIEGKVNVFILSCICLVLLEVFLMEPLRTLIKAIGFMIFKDLGLFHKFCEKI